MFVYVPCTPGGSLLFHLESETEEEAWEALLDETAHMPYQSVEALKSRGYSVVKVDAEGDDKV